MLTARVAVWAPAHSVRRRFNLRRLAVAAPKEERASMTRSTSYLFLFTCATAWPLAFPSEQESDRHRARPRVAGLRLGHRGAHRNPLSPNQGRLISNAFLDSRADDSAGPNEKENPPLFYAVPTRPLRPRQLPTDHVPAVPTREYQSDQSSRNALGCCRPCCPKCERRHYPSAPPPPPTLRSGSAPAPLRLRRLALLLSS
jgi:hypothetical protein